MARHKRRGELLPIERDALIRDFETLHIVMMQHCRNLNPVSSDYAHILRLSEGMISAIRGLTGRDPSWMRSAASQTTIAVISTAQDVTER